MSTVMDGWFLELSLGWCSINYHMQQSFLKTRDRHEKMDSETQIASETDIKRLGDPAGGPVNSGGWGTVGKGCSIWLSIPPKE